MQLTDLQWELLEPLFSKPAPGRKGRPQRDPREVLNGILWILKTGARFYANVRVGPMLLVGSSCFVSLRMTSLTKLPVNATVLVGQIQTKYGIAARGR